MVAAMLGGKDLGCSPRGGNHFLNRSHRRKGGKGNRALARPDSGTPGAKSHRLGIEHRKEGRKTHKGGWFDLEKHWDQRARSFHFLEWRRTTPFIRVASCRVKKIKEYDSAWARFPIAEPGGEDSKYPGGGGNRGPMAYYQKTLREAELWGNHALLFRRGGLSYSSDKGGGEGKYEGKKDNSSLKINKEDVCAAGWIFFGGNGRGRRDFYGTGGGKQTEIGTRHGPRGGCGWLCARHGEGRKRPRGFPLWRVSSMLYKLSCLAAEGFALVGRKGGRPALESGELRSYMFRRKEGKICIQPRKKSREKNGIPSRAKLVQTAPPSNSSEKGNTLIMKREKEKGAGTHRARGENGTPSISTTNHEGGGVTAGDKRRKKK